MKRIFLGLMFLNLIAVSIFAMEEKHAKLEGLLNYVNEERMFLQALEEMKISDAMLNELRADNYPIIAFCRAYQVISQSTSRSKHEHLRTLKALAKKHFAQEYTNNHVYALNDKLRIKFIQYIHAHNSKYGFSDERNEIIKLIIAGANPNIKVKYQNKEFSLLEIAVYSKDIYLIILLQAYNADLNLRTNGRTALMNVTTNNGNLDKNNDSTAEIIYFLVTMGADVNLQEETTKETALMFAITALNVEAVRQLLKNGANILITNFVGQSALHYINSYFNQITPENRDAIFEISKLMNEEVTRLSKQNNDFIVENSVGLMSA